MVLDLLPLACTLIIAPGVNSALLFSSGARFGIGPSLPHILGSVFAFLVILLGANAGLASLIVAHSGARMVLSAMGGAFVVFLGIRLFFAAPLDLDTPDASKPMTSGQAIALMLLNPGAYVLAITAVAIAAGSETARSVQIGTLLAVFTLAGAIATFGWAYAGVLMRRVIRNPNPGKVLNRLLGTVIILSGISLIIQ